MIASHRRVTAEWHNLKRATHSHEAVLAVDHSRGRIDDQLDNEGTERSLEGMISGDEDVRSR